MGRTTPLCFLKGVPQNASKMNPRRNLVFYILKTREIIVVYFLDVGLGCGLVWGASVASFYQRLAVSKGCGGDALHLHLILEHIFVNS